MFSSVKKSSKSKRPLKVREVKILRPHQLCEWSVSRSVARDYTGDVGAHKKTLKKKVQKQVKYRHC